MSTFEATVVPGTDRAELRLSGDLDLAAADRLIAAATAATADGGSLALDLADVTFMDSTGLGALIRIRNEVTAAGGELVVTAVSAPVERVMTMTGLAEVFAITPVEG